jgi:hypothetical protein
MVMPRRTAAGPDKAKGVPFMLCGRCKDVLPAWIQGRQVLRSLTARERYWMQFLICQHCGSLLGTDCLAGATALDRLGLLAGFGLHSAGKPLLRPREPRA